MVDGSVTSTELDATSPSDEDAPPTSPDAPEWPYFGTL